MQYTPFTITNLITLPSFFSQSFDTGWKGEGGEWWRDVVGTQR